MKKLGIYEIRIINM